MITLTGVTKNYPSSQRPASILENVNLKVTKGEFMYVVGDSGAGKTTLLKMLYGEEVPNRGTIQILGQDLAKADARRIQALRRRIGVIFQDLRLIDDLSAYDNVALSLETSDINGPQNIPHFSARRAIDESLAMVGAGAFAKKRVSSLSGGERQRVAAARAIVRQPEILIADEPTGSLDREHTWSLMDLFQKLHLRGATVLIATHDREIVRRVRRRSCVLKSGKLVVEEGICMF
ncbi:MAG: ATP-binding cassette domain-containing protein [Deltaproteobacteria bacterium]|nr:ATP-binding cassette domain-containing protein [Deltaproteobacteria bacterium]